MPGYKVTTEDSTSAKPNWWSKHSSKAKELFSGHDHEVSSQNEALTPPSQQSWPAAPVQTNSSRNSAFMDGSGTAINLGPKDTAAAITQVREYNMPTTETKTPLASIHSTPVASQILVPMTQKDSKEATVEVEHTIFQLWNDAWEDLRIKDPKLVTKYEKILTDDLGVNAMQAVAPPSSSNMNGDLRLQEMKEVLKQKMQAIDDKKWVLKFKGHELAVKDMIEPMVSIIDWGKDYVGGALQTSPYGSLAWAGVCLLLPLVLNPGKQEAARVHSLAEIADILSRCAIREELYNRHYAAVNKLEDFTAAEAGYKEALKNLYVEILRFQAVCVCYMAESTSRRTVDDVAKCLIRSRWGLKPCYIFKSVPRIDSDSTLTVNIRWTGWDDLLSNIQDRETKFAKIEDAWRDAKYEEDRQIQQERHAQNLAKMDAIKEEISRVRQAVEDAQNNGKRDALLSWLSDVDPSFNYNKARDNHGPSTGDWLVNANDDFKKWKELPNSLLWLYGKAGSGKSFLSSSIIHHLKSMYDADPYTAIAYYYFSFSETSKQTTVGLLSSLIVQLSGHRPDTPQPLLDLKRYKDINQRPDLESLEETFQATTADFQKVYLVIDALDECPEADDEREKLLDCLVRMHSWGLPNFHMAFTSRNEFDIGSKISPILSPTSTPPSNVHTGFEMDLQECYEAVNHDISTFIDQKLASSAYKTWGDKIKSDTKKALIEKADGMFLYVAMQLSSLEKIKFPNAIQKALLNLPKGLDEMYLRILNSIEDDDRRVAITALTWLVFSVKPLCLEELASASSIDPSITDYAVSPIDQDKVVGSPEVFIELLSGLVWTWKEDLEEFDVEQDQALETLNFDDRDDGSQDGSFIASKGKTYIELFHFSVREYLMSQKLQKSNNSEFFLDTDEANTNLLRSCLIYHLYASNTLPSNENNSEPEQCEHNLSIWDYAAQNWGYHYEVVACVPKDLEALAMEALRPGSRALSQSISYFRGSEYITHEDESTMRIFSSNPLFFTVATGSLRLTELAASQPTTEINIIAGPAGTALHMAAKKGHLQVVKVLLDNGANVHLSCGKKGTALNLAVAGGYLEIVQQLLDHGADACANNEESGSPLHHAAASPIDSPKIITLLLEKGADVNAYGGEYATPLQAAAHRGKTYLVQLFLDKGADINASGGKYGNSLQAAANTDKGLKVVELLLEKKADINATGGKYGTALQAAAYNGSAPIVRLLLQKGANINATGGMFGNALQAAVAGRSDDVVQLLLDGGADVNESGGIFGRALYAAAAVARDSGYEWRESAVVKDLLEHGASVHASGPEWEQILVGVGENVEKFYDAGTREYANELAQETIQYLRDFQREYEEAQ